MQARPVVEFVLPGTGEFCRMRRCTWADMVIAMAAVTKLGSQGFLLPALAQRLCTFDDKEKTLDQILALDIDDFVPIQNHLNAQVNMNNIKGV
jgi:hypothetical protein